MNDEEQSICQDICAPHLHINGVMMTRRMEMIKKWEDPLGKPYEIQGLCDIKK